MFAAVGLAVICGHSGSARAAVGCQRRGIRCALLATFCVHFHHRSRWQAPWRRRRHVPPLSRRGRVVYRAGAGEQGMIFALCVGGTVSRGGRQLINDVRPAAAPEIDTGVGFSPSACGANTEPVRQAVCRPRIGLNLVSGRGRRDKNRAAPAVLSGGN